jgi:hypothetical protein
MSKPDSIQDNFSGGMPLIFGELASDTPLRQYPELESAALWAVEWHNFRMP